MSESISEIQKRLKELTVPQKDRLGRDAPMPNRTPGPPDPKVPDEDVYLDDVSR
jgi:hypothetical protein